ncbi:peptidyl-prolyl cis-trans isomerase G isoform X4 [Spodoptera frugiperda]|uniref:Peptidyl-prolyl cis-trans isomerase G isoform X4 n=1 Tax=Spodoptera frugiperda TaxID=7108 RepID=A0A9R0EKE8_SPOFR|nr:peptidyl-prolyl cis-trans isomerase G isoform X4 [Spodoptera frugiperda]
MSEQNLDLSVKEENDPAHPWEKYIKDTYLPTYKYGHNSARNPIIYPPPKEDKAYPNRVKFTVIGNRVTKEFIYCMKLVKGLYKYRWKSFDVPDIRAVTSVEWPKVWNDLKIQFGGNAYCLQSQVAILMNGQFLGGEKDLKELIESKYVYHLKLNYYDEAVQLFSNFVKLSGRPCAYFQVSIDDEEIGTMIFMLYSDIAPRTCENFLRLCKEKKCGYSGTPVHRIVKDSWIQCGGFGLKDSELDCENFIVPHDRRGVLGMANAGRHVDCSTQFFVSLQPQPWMAYKYVAFGQLISGEETLKKIEEVPTWYESPSKSIIFHNAGILNMECQDIKINKHTNRYLEGHIEYLHALGETFYEAVLEKVFLQVDRKRGRIEDASSAGEDLRATQRFMRNKEEIDQHIEESPDEQSRDDQSRDDQSRHDQSRHDQSRHEHNPSPDIEKSENDFDADNFDYDPEEYTYKQTSRVITGSEKAKREQPYYLPFTDVPYVGEVDSDFNLRRLLQGDYCLESDLDKEMIKKPVKPEHRFSFPSHILEALETPPTESESEDSTDSEEIKEIQQYLKTNADRVSFAGGTVKAVAKQGKFNLYERQKQLNTITDEILRKYKMAEDELRANKEKRVSISLPHSPFDQHKEIHRRQTGFVRPEDMAELIKFQKDDPDEEAEEDDLEVYLPYTRQIRISQAAEPATEADKKKTERRQTGFVRKDDLEKLEIFHKKEDTFVDDNKGDDEADDDVQDHDPKRKTVRMTHEAKRSSRDREDPRSSRIRARFSFDEEEYENREERPSLIGRLLDATSTYNDLDPLPTLKEYKTFSEMQQQKNNLFLTHDSPSRLLLARDESRENYLKRHSITMDIPQKSIDQVLLLQHGKKVYRKISSDYVKTIDHIEQKQENSLRSLEYAKKRPAISVKDYQKMNQEYQAKATEIDESKIKDALESSPSPLASTATF